MHTKTKPEPILLSVVKTTMLAKRMKRITFHSPKISSYPSEQASAYLKFFYSHNQQHVLRPFTIVNHREQACEIDVDFVLHTDAGPASAWAENASMGDTIFARGPGPKKLVDLSADWFFLIGDMTSLPAICANLKTLNPSSQGYIVIEVHDEFDELDLAVPQQMQLHWVHNPTPGLTHSKWASTVRELTILNGRPSVWLAGEFSGMKSIRHYFKNEVGIAKQNIYASSYWKHGLQEEEHKIEKKKDAADILVSS